MSNWLQHLAYKWTIVPRLNKLKRLLPDAMIVPTGSRYVCNPPVFLTDVDFLVYTEDPFINEWLELCNFKLTPWQEYGNVQPESFSSWRKGVINLIVSNKKKFVERHFVATEYCKQKNVRDKTQRVIIHVALRDGKYDDCDKWVLYPEYRPFVESIMGPHGNALYHVYKAQQGISL